MWSNKRVLISSFIVGILGAGITAAFISMVLYYYRRLWYGLMPWGTGSIQLLAPVIIGFLICFFISLLFLKLMRGKHWLLGIGYGLLLGAIVGAIIVYTVFLDGCINQYLRTPEWWKLENPARYNLEDCYYVPIIPSIFGSFIGAFIGLLLSIVFAPWLLKIINKPLPQKDLSIGTLQHQ